MKPYHSAIPYLLFLSLLCGCVSGQVFWEGEPSDDILIVLACPCDYPLDEGPDVAFVTPVLFSFFSFTYDQFVEQGVTEPRICCFEHWEMFGKYYDCEGDCLVEVPPSGFEWYDVRFVSLY